MMLKGLILLLVITVGAYAQQKENLIDDALNSEKAYRLPLRTLFRYAPSESRFYAYDTSLYSIEPVRNLYYNTFLNNEEKHDFSFYKNRLLKAMSKIPEFRQPGDLGVVSSILGYAGAAATGYILYEHIRKYKDEY